MNGRYSALALISVAMIMSQWGCKNNNIVGTSTPITATLSGTVVSSNSSTPVQGATVILAYGSTVDSIITGNDGTFQFSIDMSDTSGVNVTLTVYGNGFRSVTNRFNVKTDKTFQISLSIDPTDYAIVNGLVQDSVQQWPLPGATVVVSLSGTSGSVMKYMDFVKSRSKSISSFVIDSTTTNSSGNFILNIQFPSYLNSVSATMTVAKAGFVTYQVVRTFRKGTTESVTVPLQQDITQSVAHLVGQVTDSRSLLPITNVSVILTSTLRKDTIKTLTDGSYSFDFNLPGASSSVSGTLLFQLNSYNDTTVNFSVNAGQTLTKNVALSAKPTIVGGDSNTARGVARSISLVSVTPQEISVHGVGKNETSVLVWKVLDSLGFPIDINHQTKVGFSITEVPNGLGGAYVTPAEGVTDGSGQVSTTINSGTAAGTIQLTAQLALSNGTIVETRPVPITVDGGLPDQSHFMLNSDQPHVLNFAGYDWSEVTQGFTAQAGDKYGNPVAPGTAVYFNTTSGIITAADQTDATGHATATLYSGNPVPSLPVSVLTNYRPDLPSGAFGDGTGYAFVKAWTQGENNAGIADSDLICISATALYPEITLLSPSDTVHNGGYLEYRVHISDRFGNPLEAGTTIKASVVQPPPPPGGGGVVWSILPAGLGLAGSSGTSYTLTDNLVRDIGGSTGSTDFIVRVSATLTQGAPPQITGFDLAIDIQGRNTNKNTYENTIHGVAVAP
jgi:hypothetical protein